MKTQLFLFILAALFLPVLKSQANQTAQSELPSNQTLKSMIVNMEYQVIPIFNDQESLSAPRSEPPTSPGKDVNGDRIGETPTPAGEGILLLLLMSGAYFLIGFMKKTTSDRARSN